VAATSAAFFGGRRLGGKADELPVILEPFGDHRERKGNNVGVVFSERIEQCRYLDDLRRRRTSGWRPAASR